MAFLNVANNADSTLLGGIDSVVTSLVVDPGDGADFPAAPFVISIDGEIIYVGAKAADTFSTLTRGYESTTPTAHGNKAVVENRWTAGQVNDIVTLLEAHKTQHDPEDGSDPLDTAAPGSIDENANAVGTSHSFSRADHNHQHLAALHENGGGAEISVAGLSGLLDDDQNPVTHELGGADHTVTTPLSMNNQELQDIGAAGNEITATTIKLAASGTIAAQNATNAGVQNVGGQSFVSVNDNESFNIVFGTTLGLILVQDGDGAGAVFFVEFLTGTIVKLADPSNRWDVTDIDGNPGWAIFKGATTTTVTIKNYMNATKALRVNIFGPVVSATAPS